MKEKYFEGVFKIIGKFNPDELIDIIGVKPCNIVVNEDVNELHFGYHKAYGNFDCWSMSNLIYEVIKDLINKDTLLAKLKEKYNLKFDLPINTNAIDIKDVLVLDGKITTFLHYSNTHKDLKWYYF